MVSIVAARTAALGYRPTRLAIAQNATDFGHATN